MDAGGEIQVLSDRLMDLLALCRPLNRSLCRSGDFQIDKVGDKVKRQSGQSGKILVFGQLLCQVLPMNLSIQTRHGA